MCSLRDRHASAIGPTGALLDRLAHHAKILEIGGETGSMSIFQNAAPPA
jgi:hypothetical protein